MSVLIGVGGMVVLAAVYVGLALADRGRSGCGGCALRDLEKACGGCKSGADEDALGWIEDTDESERWKP